MIRDGGGAAGGLFFSPALRLRLGFLFFSESFHCCRAGTAHAAEGLLVELRPPTIANKNKIAIPAASDTAALDQREGNVNQKGFNDWIDAGPENELIRVQVGDATQLYRRFLGVHRDLEEAVVLSERIGNPEELFAIRLAARRDLLDKFGWLQCIYSDPVNTVIVALLKCVPSELIEPMIDLLWRFYPEAAALAEIDTPFGMRDVDRRLRGDAIHSDLCNVLIDNSKITYY